MASRSLCVPHPSWYRIPFGWQPCSRFARLLSWALARTTLLICAGSPASFKNCLKKSTTPRFCASGTSGSLPTRSTLFRSRMPRIFMARGPLLAREFVLGLLQKALFLLSLALADPLESGGFLGYVEQLPGSLLRFLRRTLGGAQVLLEHPSDLVPALDGHACFLLQQPHRAQQVAVAGYLVELLLDDPDVYQAVAHGVVLRLADTLLGLLDEALRGGALLPGRLLTKLLEGLLYVLDGPLGALTAFLKGVLQAVTGGSLLPLSAIFEKAVLSVVDVAELVQEHLVHVANRHALILLSSAACLGYSPFARAGRALRPEALPVPAQSWVHARQVPVDHRPLLEPPGLRCCPFRALRLLRRGLRFREA